jgi:hypothetical protein
MATQAQRHHMLELMNLIYAHREQINYPTHDQRGPSDQVTFRMTEQQMDHVLHDGGHLTADCSELVTEICRWAGLKDPSGFHYRYAGYTGSMLSYLPHYSDPEKANIGALVVFGPGTGEHVSMVYETGKDPLLQSHGRPGIDRWRLSEERTWHRPPVTFLSIAHL